jgi:hypothetical protein
MLSDQGIGDVPTQVGGIGTTHQPYAGKHRDTRKQLDSPPALGRPPMGSTSDHALLQNVLSNLFNDFSSRSSERYGRIG